VIKKERKPTVVTEKSQETVQIEVFDESEDHAYVITVDGERAGKAVYHIRGGRYFFVHTEIDPEFEGKRLGSRLVQFALEDVKLKEGSVVPICPFVRGYIKRHAEYDELIDHEILARIERSEAKHRDEDDLELK
jgi:predicted GNAT family acetyltransferase